MGLTMGRGTSLTPIGLAGVIILASGIVVALAGLARRLDAPLPIGAAVVGSQRAQAESAGIDQVRVMLTGTGHLLDLRYRVIDPVKASRLLARGTKLSMVHHPTGTRLAVPSAPKTGQLRSSGDAASGRSYFALFANPRRVVKQGDRVSVSFDELVVEGLLVE